MQAVFRASHFSFPISSTNFIYKCTCICSKYRYEYSISYCICQLLPVNLFHDLLEPQQSLVPNYLYVIMQWAWIIPRCRITQPVSKHMGIHAYEQKFTSEGHKWCDIFGHNSTNNVIFEKWLKGVVKPRRHSNLQLQRDSALVDHHNCFHVLPAAQIYIPLDAIILKLLNYKANYKKHIDVL